MNSDREDMTKRQFLQWLEGELASANCSIGPGGSDRQYHRQDARIEVLEEVLDQARRLALKYKDDEIPDLSEVGGHWDDRKVEWHGCGVDRAAVASGRRIARIPGYDWPAEPEACTAGLTDTMWILDGRVLLCRGCGIDGT